MLHSLRCGPQGGYCKCITGTLLEELLIFDKGGMVREPCAHCASLSSLELPAARY